MSEQERHWFVMEAGAVSDERWTIWICPEGCPPHCDCHAQFCGAARQPIEVVPTSRLAEVEADRDGWRRNHVEALQRATGAEAECDRLRDRLVDIAYGETNLAPLHNVRQVREFARVALNPPKP